MKLGSYIFTGTVVVALVLGTGVVAAAAPTRDTGTAVMVQEDGATVTFEQQAPVEAEADDVVAVAESQPSAEVLMSDEPSVVVVQPQVVGQDEQAILAMYGMAVARTFIYEVLQKHTPMDENTPQRQALLRQIKLYGVLAVASVIAILGVTKGVIETAEGESSRLSNAFMFVTLLAGFTSYTIGCALTGQAHLEYTLERLGFLTEAELRALLKTCGNPSAKELAESLAAVQQWFVTIKSNLCAIGYQQTLPLFDTQLFQVIANVDEVLAEKALVDQKRHPTEQEIVAIQTKLAGALGDFAAYVLAVLNDKKGYLNQVS